MNNLADALNKLSGPGRRRQVDSIYETNNKIVDELITEIKKLNKDGRSAEAGKLITIAQAVLDSNRAYKSLIEQLMKESGSNQYG